jgi:predicted ATPase
MRTKLTKLTLSGFKSISPEHPLELELGDITVLIGANGSGKSNIISFFKMLNRMMRGEFFGYVARTGGSKVYLYEGSKHTQSIHATLCFEDESIKEYKFELASVEEERLSFKSEELTTNEGQKWNVADYTRETSLIPSGMHGNWEGVVSDRYALERRIRDLLDKECRVFRFQNSTEGSVMRQSSPKDFGFELLPDGSNLAAFLHRLQMEFPPYYNRIISYIQQVMPSFGDFYWPSENDRVMLRWKEKNADDTLKDYILIPAQYSDGALRFIALATLLLQPPQTIPNIILIDEPELGLHPYAINQLGYMIKAAAEHAQVIIATQSPELLNEFKPEQITVVERDEGESYTIAHRLNTEELKDWLERYSLSELWDKNLLGGQP